ncbi:hypothetical protein [Nocardioides sp.]|uniref:hypothetical protein n=1 Tax=Nocardioides sp. TaxID=35761 RepID=UPI002610FEC1|nr:hypothetical protein [Nocardioides sp.]MCW2737133.1 hypothetical protein [Nocardioides sp.]
MFQHTDTQPYDVLSHGDSVLGRPENLGIGRTSCGGAVADQEVPLFALLRSTHGLPLDDRRWWPERPVRHRRAPAAEATDGEDPFAAGGRTIVADGVFPTARELSPPTTELLERTLAGLRAWSTVASADRLRPVGRHQLAPSVTLAGDRDVIGRR